MALSAPAFAQVFPAPPLMNFQGRLAKPDGTPVPDGSHSVVFSIYTAPMGGTLLWSEMELVSSHNGAIAILLGQHTALNAAIFAGNTYLQIAIDGAAPLTPMQRIVTVAHAFEADTVPDGSITGVKIAPGTITSDKLAGGSMLTLPYAATVSSSSNLFSVINTGAGYGGYFKSSGYGLYGETMQTNGNGITGEANTGTNAYGVAGSATQGIGGRFFGGLYGAYTSSTDGSGLYAVSATNSGVMGVSSGGGGFAGVSGTDNNASGTGVAGYSTGSTGVYGEGAIYGGYFTSSGTDGLYAESTASGGNGLVGVANVGASAYGVEGAASQGYGGYFSGGAYGVFGFSSSGYAGYFAGTLNYTGALTHNSDARYKKNIVTLDNALENILALRGVSYDYRRDEFKDKNFAFGTQFGFIAQEVETVLPSLVHKDKAGYRSLDYTQVIPVLVEAVKTQQAQLESQKREIAELKQQNAAIVELKKQLAAVLEAVKQNQKANK